MTDDQTMPDILATALRLAPAVRAAREQAEAMRRTPPDLATQITAAGLYQMYLPGSIGGPELPPLTVYRVVEEISRADGSVGWNVMIANAMALNLGRLPPDVSGAMAGNPPDYRAAGSARSGGGAWPVPGGFRVKGRWNFASGVDNARWLYCTCNMMEGDTRTPVLRALWVPREQGTVLDTWHTMGMRGTGSRDFVIDDVFVPAERSVLSSAAPAETGPLFKHRAWYVHLWTPSAANVLGIARGAIDELKALASTEASTLNTALLRDRSAVQARLGEAEAIVNAARAYVFDAVGGLWRVLSAGQEPTDELIAQARLALVHAMHESVRAVDKVFHAAGTNAIYQRLPLERAFRDVHVAMTHGAAMPLYFESAGKALLGLRPGDPGW